MKPAGYDGTAGVVCSVLVCDLVMGHSFPGTQLLKYYLCMVCQADFINLLLKYLLFTPVCDVSERF